MLSRHQFIAACVLVCAITNGVAYDLGDAIALNMTELVGAAYTQPAQQIHSRSQQTTNMSDVATIGNTDGIPQRALMRKANIHLRDRRSTNPREQKECYKSSTSTRGKKPDVKDCRQEKPRRQKKCTWTSTSASGTTSDVDGCKSYKHTIFVQSWIPSTIYSDTKFLRPTSRDVADDWNRKLKIHGLWPQDSRLPKKWTPLTQEAKNAIDKKAWPLMRIKEKKKRSEPSVPPADGKPSMPQDGVERLTPAQWIAWRSLINSNWYEHEWGMHGSWSGFSEVQYVNEIQRIHRNHATPKAIQLDRQQFIQHKTLMSAFPKNAFVVCKSNAREQYFHEVRYCYEVDPDTHLATKLVEYNNCERRDPRFVCTDDEILIMHTEEDSKY